MNRILFIILFLILIKPFCFALEDEFVKQNLNGINIKKPECNLNYNYQNMVKIPVKLKTTCPIKSENNLYEGQILGFKSIDDVIYKDKTIIKKDEIITAKVETIIKNGMNGIPASVVLGNFESKNIDAHYFQNDFEKYGVDLSLLVFPLKWALTFLPPTGSLTNFIKGGHVNFKKNEIITIYYFADEI